MSKNMSRVGTFLGALCLLTQAAPANAQGLFSGGNACCPTCCPQPVCMQPVVRPCYQTVPVTTYQQVTQTVQRPVCKTEYIEEPVTEYRPVTETRTAQVPTCSYQPVTECIPQTCDRGCYQTFCRCNPRMSPCQYDPNPGLLGWMNRTGYEMRMAFTPPVTYERRWIPNYVTTYIPRTRQVAVQSVRQVAYNVTRLEPHQTTRRVAVNRVTYETAQITVNRPITVMATVPIGTSVAWLPMGATGTATAAVPTPDPISKSANKYDDSNKFRRAEKQKADGTRTATPGLDNEHGMIIPRTKGESMPSQAARPLPSAVRLNGWIARNRTATTLSASQPARSGISVVAANP